MTKKTKLRHGRHCIFMNQVHLVFTPKYRRRVFTGAILVRLEEIFAETCLQMDCRLIEFNGEKDHVHLLVEVHPKVAISNLVGKMKGKSSWLMRQEFWEHIKKFLWGDKFWTHSYCVVSCGGASIDVVKKYIEEQVRPA